MDLFYNLSENGSNTKLQQKKAEKHTQINTKTKKSSVVQWDHSRLFHTEGEENLEAVFTNSVLTLVTTNSQISRELRLWFQRKCL